MKRLALPLGVLLLTALAFAPATHNGFTNWDDPAYVLQNQLLRDLSPAGLRAIATTFVEGNYHPLTMFSLALDYQGSGLDPAAYHRTNVHIHLLGTLAVFWFILVLTESSLLAAITSLFFGIHPLHVESVAWISARKDLLYGLFYFVSCASYVLYARKRLAIYWIAALLAFALSLLSKGMAVTLPLALVAIDFYLRRPQSARTWLEKAPFFLLALAFGVIAVMAQQRAVQEFTEFPFWERLLVAFYGLASYLVRAVAPVGLSAFYPYPVGRALPVTYYLAPLLTAALALGIAKTMRRDRIYAFSALFFLMNVLLVLQLYPVGSAAMADRYTYVAYVGVGLALASGFRALRRLPSQRGTAAQAATWILLGGLFLAWILTTRARIPVWRDNITLWTDVLSHSPDLPMAYAQRAWSYHQKGEGGAAMDDLDKALTLDPKNGEALSTRGTLYYLSGDYTRALMDLNEAVRQRPLSASARNNRGTALLAAGNTDEAIADFTKAIELKPWFTEAYLNRGLSYGVKREYAKALPDFDRALAFEEGNPQAHVWRAAARLALGDPAGAIADCDEALRIDPRFAQAYLARANSYERAARYQNALEDALRARDLGAHVDSALVERLRAAAVKQ